MILLLSALSGVASLIYEVVWFQQLELVVGSTAVSLGMLLAAFMGGTCLGSLLFPRFVAAQRNPLKVYAIIEAGIGALGMLALFLIPVAGGFYTTWAGTGLQGFVVRGAVAALCLLPPTLSMGAMLPALSRTFKASADRASHIGVLYTFNIGGAVFGCLLSGFYLLREYDAATAAYVAVAINFVIAAIAMRLSKTKQPAILPVQPQTSGRAATSATSFIYITIAVSGFCALGSEAIWTRVLGLLFGASVYTLSIILAVFLTGLGIGSGLGSRLARAQVRPVLALGYCQLSTAVAIAWAVYTMNRSLPFWPIDPSTSRGIWFTFALDLARAALVLLPATILWGASFPLALAATETKDQASAQETGTLVARVYSANTLGAILGALGASLLLVTWLGSQRTEQVLIAFSTVAGLLLVLPSSRLRWTVAGVSIFATSLCIYSVPPTEKLLIAHGRYAASWVGKGDIVYANEGVNSSVAVTRFTNELLTFHVAGKIQASNNARDMRLQRMLGHLTTLTATHPRSVLVIGCGAGITAGAVSIDPLVEHEIIVEIEPLVPEAAATYFHEANFEVLTNPNVQLRIDDGRHFLLTTKERFDGITIDPLDPWVKGAASLYTKEFFEVMKQHLNPGGSVTMYIQLFETNLPAVKSALATFFEVFPNATVWGNPYQGKGHDMVLLGQTEPLHVDLDRMEERVNYHGDSQMSQSLTEVGMNSPVELFATYAGRASDLTQWVTGAAINRDGNLQMQYLAGLGLDRDDAAEIYAELLTYRHFPDDIFQSTEGRVDSLKQATRRGP